MGVKLEPEDLRDAWGRWDSERDPRAREQLVCHYMPMVDSLAGRLRHGVADHLVPELYSAGAEGLLDALEKFKPEMGNMFETYGPMRIRGAMLDGVRRMSPIPRSGRGRLSGVIRWVVTVDFQTARTPVGAKLTDCLPDSDHCSALERLVLEADYEELIEAVEALPARERFVIREYYYEAKTLKVIGRQLGLTESRICQIHRAALKKLEQSLIIAQAA